MICKFCQYAVPDTAVYDNIHGELLVGVKCSNRRSIYWHSLLNISPNGDIYPYIAWIGCEFYKEKIYKVKG